jgi:N-acyl-D-amino-acid deacylase
MATVVIKGGTIVDGTGAAPFVGDVALDGGRIVEIGGRIDAGAARVIDADGAIVAPGWVDVHTHYDGQVTWDDQMEPSTANGVTTVVMGNCGVGFAPVPPGGERTLIELMEGVEDIPGTALHEGMPWGSWSTFAEYLDVLGKREYALDVGAQIAHGALRYSVMGERGVNNEDATADDLAELQRVVADAMRAGAVGFSTSRTIGHRSITGGVVPGTYAAESELAAIATAMGRGVFQAIGSGTIGKLESLGGEQHTTDDETAMLVRLAELSGRPVTFTCVQIGEDPTGWRRMVDLSQAANDRGLRVHPQIANRQVGLLASFAAYHPFMARPTFVRLAGLPHDAKIAELRKPEIKAAILAERSERSLVSGQHMGLANLYKTAVWGTWVMDDPTDYEPSRATTIGGRAKAAGVDPLDLYYDLLLEKNGRAFAAVLGSNYVDGNLDVCREMLIDPATVSGLSDAGAHVNFICDVAMPTFGLTFWTRDRVRGEQIPIEQIVMKQTKATAHLYGMTDRGVIAPGLRGDINVIDHANLRILPPESRNDLPAGGSRVLQRAEGYLATLVNGVVTRERDIDTGARPGRLVRSQ